MAAVTGAVTFDGGGKPRSLRFTTNALCLLEDRINLTTLEVGRELAFGKQMPLAVSKKTLRAIYWAGCGDLTLDEAGDLIDSIGQARAVELAIEAYDAAFPDAVETGGAADEGEKSPPIAPAG